MSTTSITAPEFRTTVTYEPTWPKGERYFWQVSGHPITSEIVRSRSGGAAPTKAAAEAAAEAWVTGYKTAIAVTTERNNIK